MSEFFGDESVIVPDLPEPILAYRAWTWNGRTERLVGFGGSKWKRTKATVAEHRGARTSIFSTSFPTAMTARPCVECPSANAEGHDGYGCGIYGFDSVGQLAGHASTGASQVWGQVELGGTVYEHAHGYRASHGQVKAIYRVPSAPAARKAAKRYGVDLIDFPLSQAEIDAMRAEAKPTAAFSTSLIQSFLSGPFQPTTPSVSYTYGGPVPGCRCDLCRPDLLASGTLGTPTTDLIIDEVSGLWTPPTDGDDADG